MMRNFLLEQTFSGGVGVQESKQEVTKYASLVETLASVSGLLNLFLNLM